MAIYGPPDACVRALREVATAGAELMLFTPFVDQAQQVERIAAEISPRLSYSADHQKARLAFLREMAAVWLLPGVACIGCLEFEADPDALRRVQLAQ